MEVLLLLAVLLLSLVLIPLGMPGTWLMLGAAIGFNALTGTDRIGVVTMVGVGVLALVGEALEWTLTGRFARRYGGSRRASWGAVLGSMVGAFVGLPVPVVGSVVGAFAGCFLGAMAAELSRGTAHGAAARVATGALLGSVAAAATKVAIGVTMASWIVIAALG